MWNRQREAAEARAKIIAAQQDEDLEALEAE
jgi:hypothetical protein